MVIYPLKMVIYPLKMVMLLVKLVFFEKIGMLVYQGVSHKTRDINYLSGISHQVGKH
jgi:hypothetical protein